MYVGYLMRLCNDKDLAEELTQQTICRGLYKIKTFRGESKIQVWLCAIAKRYLNAYMTEQKKMNCVSFEQVKEKYKMRSNESIEEYS